MHLGSLGRAIATAGKRPGFVDMVQVCGRYAKPLAHHPGFDEVAVDLRPTELVTDDGHRAQPARH